MADFRGFFFLFCQLNKKSASVYSFLCFFHIYRTKNTCRIRKAGVFQPDVSGLFQETQIGFVDKVSYAVGHQNVIKILLLYELRYGELVVSQVDQRDFPV